MAGNVLNEYVAASAFTVTNLHSLAASTTWVTGWTSVKVSNTTNDYSDYLISGTFVTASSSRNAGYLYIYAYSGLGDTTMSAGVPDLFSSGTEGTEGTATVHSTQARDGGMRLLHTVGGNNTASAVFTMPSTSIRQAFGYVPPEFAIWITGNLATTTAAQLAASGSAVYYTPVHHRYT